MTDGFRHDRIMSLHRRAYDVIAGGGTFDDWKKLATRLGFTDPSAVAQFWTTASLAHEYGMPAKFAFPLFGELDQLLAPSPPNTPPTTAMFTCRACGGTFEKAWDDQEAVKEMRAAFGDVPEVDRRIVCDDCYQQMVAVKPSPSAGRTSPATP